MSASVRSASCRFAATRSLFGPGGDSGELVARFFLVRLRKDFAEIREFELLDHRPSIRNHAHPRECPMLQKDS